MLLWNKSSIQTENVAAFASYLNSRLFVHIPCKIYKLNNIVSDIKKTHTSQTGYKISDVKVSLLNTLDQVKYMGLGDGVKTPVLPNTEMSLKVWLYSYFSKFLITYD